MTPFDPDFANTGWALLLADALLPESIPHPESIWPSEALGVSLHVPSICPA